MNKKILQVENLQKSFGSKSAGNKDQSIRAVDNISFYVRQNETLGLVGESGCGKTTTGKMILRLSTPESGKIIYDDIDISRFTEKQMRPYRTRIQMIFQDLDAALNPNMRIEAIISEAVKLSNPELEKYKVKARCRELLDLVHLPSGKLNQFPSELSGGEKRRVGIARTLALKPEFIVADEPTSALDVSIQAQVINLMQDLQREFGLSYLFISHDLHLVELVSHRIAVMYLGQIVELGTAAEIVKRPRHPYTASLWSSLTLATSHEPGREEEAHLGLDDFIRPREGCRFAPRCPIFHANNKPEICSSGNSEPELTSIGENHVVACHFPLE